MADIKDIGKNALEDGVEDFTQSFIYRRMQKLTKPFLKDFETGSEFDDAMQSFINTLSMGLALYAYTKVMHFFFQRGAKVFGALWTYIIAGAMKKKLVQKLKNSNFKGKKAFKTVGLMMGSDRTSDRIEIAKIAQDNVKSFDQHKMHYENQSQNASNNLDNFAQTGSFMKNGVDNSSFNMYTHKTFTGTWQNTNQDKKLFTKVTGKTLTELGLGSWSKIYLQLNKYTEFAKTVDNEVTNLATLYTKLLSRSGAIH